MPTPILAAYLSHETHLRLAQACPAGEYLASACSARANAECKPEVLCEGNCTRVACPGRQWRNESLCQPCSVCPTGFWAPISSNFSCDGFNDTICTLRLSTPVHR